MEKSYLSRLGLFFLGCFVFVNCVGIFFKSTLVIASALSIIVSIVFAYVGIKILPRNKELRTFSYWMGISMYSFFYFLPPAPSAHIEHRWIPLILFYLVISFFFAIIENMADTIFVKGKDDYAYPIFKHTLCFFIFQLLVSLSIRLASTIPWWGNLICVVVAIILLYFIADVSRRTQIADRILNP